MLNQAHQARLQTLIDDLSKGVSQAKKTNEASVTQQARERLHGILLSATLPQASSTARKTRF